MSKLLVWDTAGERIFETGVDRGVLFVMDEDGDYGDGVVWNGLSGVTENPTGAEPNPIYADNIKYLNMMSKEEFGATIEAYTYPDEFMECDGSVEAAKGVLLGQQSRKTFGLSYRTLIGNDADGDSHGYKIHLIYGALASPSDKAYQSVNETPEAITFSWDVTTTAVEVTGFKPTASLVIDTTKALAREIADLEELLYGKAKVIADATATPPIDAADAVPAKLPLPDEVIALFTAIV